MRRALLPALLLAAPLFFAWPAGMAAAQGGIGSGGLRGPVTPQQQPSTSRPPPPALPGLAGRRTPEPIPSETPGAAMAPNAALFDAITRGDIAAAREAMGRGADLNARNALGLTPVDAAVDQGRNEIAFYLLSARGSAGGGPTLAPSEPALRGRAAARPRRGAPDPRDADGPPPAAPAADDLPRTLPRTLSDPPRGGAPASAPLAPGVARARLFAGDGGAPRPEIGFLGFDAGRPAGAGPDAAPRARRGRG